MTEKKSKRDKKFSVEELYQNKNFVPPKEKNLETIFEEPRKAKDGAPVLTSVRKYRRYLHFDPTEGKIHKRKLKAKKCSNKMKTGKLRTRSAPKQTVECEDISMYIMDAIGESSDSEMDSTRCCKVDSTQNSSSPNKRTDDSGEKTTTEVNSKRSPKRTDSDQSSEQEISSLKTSEIDKIECNSVKEETTDSLPKESEEDDEKNTSRSSCIVT